MEAVHVQTIQFHTNLLREQDRLITFKDWPNDLNWACTPEKLANAGFYYNPSAESLDNVTCVFCEKELDGWEPDDEPLKEHKKHSPQCPFLSLKKPLEKLTLVEFIRLTSKMLSLNTEKSFDKIGREFNEQQQTTRDTIIECVNY